jgi:carbon-monoxide dehydrogenase large subunit
MPCTPERVWRAIQAASAPGSAPDPWREPPQIFTTLPIRGQTEELETADI